MEMSSLELIIIAVGTVAVAALNFKLLHKAKLAEIAPRDLYDPATRLDLQQLLAKANVTGSADIRDGVVQPAPDLDLQHPVLRMANTAVADFYRRTPNPNSQMLYWRNSQTGEFQLFGEFDVECVSDVIGLLLRKESE